MKMMDWKGRSYVSKAPSVRVIYMAFDTTKPGPQADKRVRQAIALGVNMETNIKKILEGNGIRLGSPLTDKHFGYDPSVKPYDYNPEKAKQLLAEAGMEPERLEMFNLSSAQGQTFADIVELMTERVRQLGPNPLRLEATSDQQSAVSSVPES